MSERIPPRLPTSAAPSPATADELDADTVVSPAPPDMSSATGAPVGPRPVRAAPVLTAAEGQRQGNLAGLITTGALHVLLILAVIISGLGLGKKESQAHPKERIIETRIVPIQAGSAAGTRKTGPAYKRSSKHRKRRYRKRSRRYRLGPSRHRMPKDGMLARGRHDPTPPDKDDATNPDPSWDSQKGVEAPAGAMASDDRHGAGGTADKGALDPCNEQHAAVVASYKQIIRKKIPRFPRPAFVSADVAQNLTTIVRVYIGWEGNITGASTAKSSGNPRYDGAAVAHIKAIGSFPKPHKCVMYSRSSQRFRKTVSVAVVVHSR